MLFILFFIILFRCLSDNPLTTDIKQNLKLLVSELFYSILLGGICSFGLCLCVLALTTSTVPFYSILSLDSSNTYNLVNNAQCTTLDSGVSYTIIDDQHLDDNIYVTTATRNNLGLDFIFTYHDDKNDRYYQKHFSHYNDSIIKFDSNITAPTATIKVYHLNKIISLFCILNKDYREELVITLKDKTQILSFNT